MKKEFYDVIIIGGGPIGLVCGLEAIKSGLKYLILEKGALVNSLYNYPDNMTFFSTSERLEIGGVPFVSNNPKPTRNEALEYYRRVAASSDLNVHLFEKVISVKRNEELFSIQTTKAEYYSSNLIISTGFYDIPYLLNVKGEELEKVRHYYTNPHYYSFQKVLVVGAANSAVDVALETWRKGATVTMVIRGDKISDRVKYWVKPDIENRIAEGSISAFFNSTIAEIRQHEVDIKTSNGMVTIENDWVLSMTGYQPDLTFLRNVDIQLSEDEVCKPTYNDENYETNVPGIYLAGVICGGMNTHRLFIENSREHAEKIINDISKKPANGEFIL
ncbi:MAG: YpdA family putative bacillithiol disulfide reductase [Ginsengibacter sp.]